MVEGRFVEGRGIGATAGDHHWGLPCGGRRPGAAPRAPVGDGEARLTYAELALDVERVACGLLALGVEKGDRVAIWAPESMGWTLVQLAAARAGAVLVILDGDWDVRELGSALPEAGVRGCWSGRCCASRQLGAGSQRAGGARAARGDCRGAVRRP